MQPRYVVNRVTAGDYNCPKEVSTFLGDLYTAFRTLNLRNDHLRKRFDGMGQVHLQMKLIWLSQQISYMSFSQHA